MASKTPHPPGELAGIALESSVGVMSEEKALEARAVVRGVESTLMGSWGPSGCLPMGPPLGVLSFPSSLILKPDLGLGVEWREGEKERGYFLIKPSTKIITK